MILLILVVLVVLSTCYEHLTAKSEQKELLVSFSLTSNTSRLLSTTDSPDSLPCLHGLRVIAMAWIIVGHRFFNLTLVPGSDGLKVVQNLGRLSWTPSQSLDKVLGIFFLLSGTLAAYNFLRDRLEGKKFNYLNFFGHRYRRLIPPVLLVSILYATLLIRVAAGPIWKRMFSMYQENCQESWLTPPVLLVSILYATLLIRVADGPIWKRMFSMYQENCQESWWINLLYINNYVVPYSTCVPWTWYVAADFQLHVLSPLLLLLMYKERTRGFLLAAFIFLVSNAAAMAFYFWHEIPAGGIVQRDQSYQKITLIQHVQTQFRLTLFIVGLCLGYLLFRIKQDQLKIKLSKPQLLTGWTVAVFLILSTVLSTSIFDDPQYVHTRWLDAVYHVWSRQAIGLAVTWVILVCTTGSGGIIDKILSWKALIPLSRLTYCVYLLHFFVQQVQIYRTRTSVTVDTLDIWYLFFADVFVSYILATLLYLGLEAPVSNIFKHLFKDSQTSTEKSQGVVMSAITNP